MFVRSWITQRNGFWKLPLATVLVAFLLPAFGCHRDDVQSYRVPKESNTPMSAPNPSLGGMPENAVPPVEDQPSLKWTLPKSWTLLPNQAGGMRFATMRAPNAEKVDIYAVVLSGTAGGELANVNRWRGQIQLPPIDEQALSSQRKILKSKAGEVTLFDFTGPNTEKNRLIVGMIKTPDGHIWFLKMTGDDGPVGKLKPDFLHWMETLRLA